MPSSNGTTNCYTVFTVGRASAASCERHSKQSYGTMATGVVDDKLKQLGISLPGVAPAGITSYYFE